MREYEVMILLAPDAEDSVVDGAVERIKGVLATRGGDVSNVDKWGRRRLAYEIAHQTEGYYAIVSFSADPDSLLELERVLTLADEVVRFKVVVRKAA